MKAEKTSETALLKVDQVSLVIEPGESIWLPVRADPPEQHAKDLGVALNLEGSMLEVAPGVWESEDSKGMLLVSNFSELMVDVTDGMAVAGLVDSSVEVLKCSYCAGVEVVAAQGRLRCRQCGHGGRAEERPCQF